MPWENIGGRAEFITFSLDGTTQLTDAVELVLGLPRRPRRQLRCARDKE